KVLPANTFTLIRNPDPLPTAPDCTRHWIRPVKAISLSSTRSTGQMLLKLQQRVHPKRTVFKLLPESEGVGTDGPGEAGAFGRRINAKSIRQSRRHDRQGTIRPGDRPTLARVNDVSPGDENARQDVRNSFAHLSIPLEFLSP